jgi:hypothetical protein
LEEESIISDNDEDIPKSGTNNKKYISTTDPDASVVRRGKATFWGTLISL